MDERSVNTVITLAIFFSILLTAILMVICNTVCSKWRSSGTHHIRHDIPAVSLDMSQEPPSYDMIIRIEDDEPCFNVTLDNDKPPTYQEAIQD